MSLKNINYFWGIILFPLIILSIKWAYISTDAPYYLSVARDISRGNVPYKDIYLSYTPVMMYLNSIIYLIFKDPSYFILLSFQFLVIALSSSILYDISFKLNKSKSRSVFFSLLFFLSVLASDGTYINLEIYVIFFVILAYWLLQRQRYFLCGMILALSFFSKQYGILNFIPFFLLIFFDQKYKKAHLIKFATGGALPLIIFFIYFILFNGVNFKSLILQLTGAGYDQDMMDLETTWFSFLAGAKIFLLLLFPFICMGTKYFRNKFDVALLFGLGINLLPLYIQTVSHYFLLCFPYIFILYSRNINLPRRNFFLSLNIIIVLIMGLLFARISRYREIYTEQLKVASETRKEYPVGSEVFLYKHFRFLYILNNYNNPVLEKVGYRYGFKPDEEFMEKYDVLSNYQKIDN